MVPDMRFTYATFVACALSLALAPRAGAAEHWLREGDRLGVMGDAVTSDGRFLERALAEVAERGGPSVAGVTTEARPGLSSANALGAADRLLSRVRPDAVVVCLGLNDRDAPASYVANMTRIVRALRDRNVAVTVLTPPAVDARGRPELAPYAESVARMARRLERVARDTGAVFADCHTSMLDHIGTGGSDLSWGDGVHPNDEGHRMMARALVAAWEKAGPRSSHTTAPAADARRDASREPTRSPSTPGRFGFANGGMTDGDAMPDGWRVVDNTSVAARDTDVYKVGPASLRCRPAGKDGIAAQHVDGGANETVTVSGFAKCSGSGSLQIAVQAFTKSWRKNKWFQLAYLHGETDWSRFEKTVTLPEWTARFRIMILVKGDATGWLDEVALE